MNIFAVDSDPTIAAQSLVDKHVVKMILESAQMLGRAHEALGTLSFPHYFMSVGKPHWHHPCTLWVQESPANYQWLAHHLSALCREYTYRYGKVHMVSRKALSRWLKGTVPLGYGNFDRAILSPFHEATGDIKAGDPVSTYRLYYHKAKSHLWTWTRREPPNWIPRELLIHHDNKWSKR